ncbi:MAG: hypothetical protein AAFR96_05285 [Planctomycetota bacterium]
MLPPPDDEFDLIGFERGVVPASHAVVRFASAGETVQVIATADARSAVESRFEQLAGAEAGESSEGVIDRVSVWCAGSSFEADLQFLDVARVHSPDARMQAQQRWQAWWLTFDRATPWEGWSIDDRPGQDASSSVGPFLDRASARRWSEMLDGIYELCREPAELRRAPAGSPCAYKEMGLCRSTCDGGERVSDHDGRVGQALSTTAGTLATERASLAAAMAAASGEGAFERAAALRDRVAALPAADDRAAGAVGPVESFRFVVVAGTGARRSARLMGVDATGWRVLGDAAAEATGEDSAAGSVDRVIDGALAWAAEARVTADRFDPAMVGVVAREVVRPRRGGPVLLRTDGLDRSALLADIRRVGGVPDSGGDGDG